MKKLSLKKTDRGINHYLHLKKDFESKNERITTSLPLFIRIMFLDHPNPWIKQINRFDFVKLVVVHKEFGKLNTIINQKTKYNKEIVKSQNNSLEISLLDFLNTEIISLNNFTYSVQEFALGLGYNGGIHMIPEGENKEKYDKLYEQLIEPYPLITLDLTRQVAQSLLETFEELYTLLTGSNTGHASNPNFAPMIVKDGQLLDGIFFKRAYIQFPIRAKKNKGIRICIEIKLSDLTNEQTNPLLSYGHRDNPELLIKLSVSNTMLVVRCVSFEKNKTLTIDISQFLNAFMKLEICIYPNGEVIVAINGIMKANDNLNTNISIIDGKIILGSNLFGTKFSEFYEKTLSIQSVDKSNNMRFLSLYSLKKENVGLQNIPSKLIKREFI